MKKFLFLIILSMLTFTNEVFSANAEIRGLSDEDMSLIDALGNYELRDESLQLHETNQHIKKFERHLLSDDEISKEYFIKHREKLLKDNTIYDNLDDLRKVISNGEGIMLDEQGKIIDYYRLDEKDNRINDFEAVVYKYPKKPRPASAKKVFIQLIFMIKILCMMKSVKIFVMIF